jgi:Fe-S cluster biogenesis protein NfuA
VKWFERLAETRKRRATPGATSGTADPSPVDGAWQRTAEVEAVLSELRPMFRADLGDIELDSIEGNAVIVRLSGACSRCQARDLTLHSALEPRLKARLAWVSEVRAI